MEDPWILPTPSPSSEPIRTDVSLPTTVIAYQANLECVQSLVLPLCGQRRRTHMCCLHGQYSLLMHMTALILFLLQTKRLLRPCRELSHHGERCIIDLTFFPELDRLEREDFRAVLSERVGSPMVP